MHGIADRWLIQLLRVGDRKNGFDDVVIPRATAQVAFETDANLLFGRVRDFVEQADRCHNHPRRAVPTLQSVILTKRLLHRMHLVALSQALDGNDRVAARLSRQNGARFHRFTVEVNRARPTRRGVATDVCTGEVAVIAEVVHKQRSIFDIVALCLAVYGHRDIHVSAPKKISSGRSSTAGDGSSTDSDRVPIVTSRGWGKCFPILTTAAGLAEL
jgi:hypothetical protein